MEYEGMEYEGMEYQGMEYQSVSPESFAEIDGLEEWRIVLGAIRAQFRATSFPAGAAMVEAIAQAAEAVDHHPDIVLRYPGRVDVTLTTHATGAVSDADVALAHTISAIAAQAGAVPDPLRSQAIEIAIDTMDADRIRPFWAAVLGYDVVAGGSLADPDRVGPPVWFQQMDEPRTERSRFHIDVSVPHDVAEQRVADAIAAGGRLVTDRYARAFWVLADVDGNEACVCTWQDRSAGS